MDGSIVFSTETRDVTMMNGNSVTFGQVQNERVEVFSYFTDFKNF